MAYESAKFLQVLGVVARQHPIQPLPAQGSLQVRQSVSASLDRQVCSAGRCTDRQHCQVH